MPRPSSTKLAISLAESTALLALLNPIPETPTANNPPEHLGNDAQRHMTLSQEEGLSTALAYLSGISDDSNHVMAVAVEERPSSSALCVKLAINKAQPDDGNRILEMVSGGFREIFDILSNTQATDLSQGDHHHTVDAVCLAVVSLCRERILTRLRSRKAKMKTIRQGKQKLMSLLESAIKAFIHTRGLAKKAEMCKQEAAPLLVIMKELEECAVGSQEQKVLRQLVKRAKRFLKAGNLEDCLRHVNNRDLNPSVGTTLVDELTKIAQYSDISRFLCEQAQKLEFLRNVEIEEIHLPPREFYTINLQSKSPDLHAVEDRLGLTGTAQRNLDQVYSRRNPSKRAAKGSFATTVRKTLTSGKIHAEMQLLCHFAVEDIQRRPRVIASSKSACFLCNMMLRLQGDYYTPHTHGHLYPGWLLPRSLLTGQGGFARRLDREIKNYTRTFLEEDSTRAPYPNPNESTTHKLNLSVSSIGSLLSSLKAAMASSRGSSTATIVPRQSNAARDIACLATSSSGSSLSPQGTIIKGGASESGNSVKVRTEAATHTLTPAPTSARSVSSQTRVLSPVYEEANPRSQRELECPQIRLRRGEPCIASLRRDQGTICVSTDFVHILLEWPAKGRAQSAAVGDCVEFEVEWLSESRRTGIKPNQATFDAYGLPTETEIECGSSGVFFLEVGDDTLKLSWSVKRNVSAQPCLACSD